MRIAILLALSATLIGCAADEEPPPLSPTTIENPDTDEPLVVEDDDLSGTSCDPGELRDCKVQLASQGDVQNCFIGMQQCDDDGLWSPCMDEDDIDFGDDDDDDED